MKKRKSVNISVLRKIMSFMLVFTMMLGLITAADVFYPTRENLAEAASFETSGSGIGAPAFNPANIPSLNTTGDIQYYYGKEGNSFYGVTDGDGYWELVDTDAKMNGTALSSKWGIGSLAAISVNNGQTLLDYTNSLVSSHFNAADKIAMLPTDIRVDRFVCSNPSNYPSVEAAGSISGAYLWPLSAKQLTARGTVPGDNAGVSTLGTKIYQNAGHYWTRSSGSWGSSSSFPTWAFYNGRLDCYGNDNVFRVAPAFNLNKSKILIAKNAASTASQTPLSSINIASGDIKFLINVGTNKSSFNVPTISGKNLTNVFAGKTYSFDYTGAGTGRINGGTNYVSAILYDSNGRIAYYGNLSTISSASGTANITIPTGLTGTYTLALFEEEKCGANKTDYASTPIYSRFTIQTRNYETNAEISSTQDSNVEVGNTITNSKFSARVTYLNGSVSTENVYLISSADFHKIADKRTIKSTSVTVPSGASTFKVTAVFVPQYTDGQSYWSKEFTYNINYEKSTHFNTSHESSFSLNDTIHSSEFDGEITWMNGTKTNVSADDMYIVPASVWGSGISKDSLKSLEKYHGGKSIKIDSAELKGAKSYSIVAVYFPKVAGAAAFHTQTFEFASATLYPTAFNASYNGEAAEFGDLLTDSDFSGRYILSDGDKTEVEAPVKYILPTETWNNLSDNVKAHESQLKKVKGVNSTVIPSESDLRETESYSITVIYYDYSEQHAYGGGTNAGECNYYSQEVSVPLAAAIIKDYKSYTASGITWYYQLDKDNNAINVHTVNEDINQAIDKNGVLGIPAEVDGHAVKSIGSGSKSRPFIPSNVNSYTSIKFPDTLTDINDYAFYANTAFVRLVIPATVSNIGNFAFYDFDNLSNAKITTTSIGAAAFGNCDGLIEVLVDGSSSIGKVAFAECINLTKLTIGGDTDIGKSAFANDAKINAINLKELNNSKIEAYAFKDCISMKEVYVPSSNKVEAHAFDGCIGITNLELDISIVENNSFEGCYNIRYLVFGKNVSTVEYNWGGYSLDTYSSNSDYTEVIDTTIYVKSKDTRFETYRDGNEFYSSFMGHYVPSGSYKYSRNVSVYMPKHAATGHSADGTLINAVANYYQTAQDDMAEGDNTFKKYYTANGLLSVTFEADENVDDTTINLPSVRDGITAYYDGKVYDNAKADKGKVIVNPIYSDAAPAKEPLKDFNFYAEGEADAAIRGWIKSTDYTYKNVIPGKLEADKEYTYSQYLQYVESNVITGDELESERLAMIQSIYEDKSLFLMATADIIDNPTIYEVNNTQNYAIQHMNVIFYPDKDSNIDKDYNENEPVYYITAIDVKVVKYTDEMYFFDQGFTYETVVKEIKELQDKIAALENDVERLENANNELADQNNSYSNQLAECKQQLNQYVMMYNKLLQDLNDYIGSTDVDDNGYFGTKTEINDKGETVTIKVVWVNGTECTYEKTDEQEVLDGITYDVYIGTGDIDGDGVPDNFKFFVAPDGVHVIEMNGTEVNEVYSDPIRALERKLTAQLTAIRSQLAGISEKIAELKKALGIEDEDFDNLSSKEQLDIILAKVNELLAEKEGLESEISENNKTMKEYEDAIEAIYQQLISGTLDEGDVSTLQEKLGKILDAIKGIQVENASLTKQCGSLEAEIAVLKEKLDGKDDIIADKNQSIQDLEESIKELQKQSDLLSGTVTEQASTIESLKESLSSLKDDNSDLRSEITDLNNNLSKLESGNEAQKEKMESLQDILSKKQEEIDNGTATVDDLKQAINQANNAVNELLAENESQSKIIVLLKESIVKLIKLGNSQKATIEELSESVGTLTEQNSALQSTITKLNETISVQKGNINNLNKMIEQLENDIAGYKNTISNQATQIKELSESAGRYVLTIEDAAELFGTSKDASADEVKASINAFVKAKVENENTIKAIQKKLNTNATGDALVALIGATDDQNPSPAPDATEKPIADIVSKADFEKLQATNKTISSENSKLSDKISTLSNELERIKAENTGLASQNEKDRKLISALDGKNGTLTKKNKALKGENTALGKKVTSLTKKNKELRAKNADLKSKPSAAGKTITKTRTVYVTPSPAVPYGNSVRTSSAAKTMPTAKPKKDQASAKPTKTPLNTAGISSELVPVANNPDEMNPYGTVITRELPIAGNEAELEGATVVGLDRDGSYVGVITSNGSKDSESSEEAKDNANIIFTYYAGHLEELANLGSEEIKEGIGDSNKIISISGIAGIDVTPSVLQSEAMEKGERFSLNLSSNEFTNGKMYLVVHESEDRAGKFDVALVVAQNGSIEIELEDLSPVSVAEVDIKDLSSFDGDGAAPSGEVAADQQTNSNGAFKAVFIVIVLLVIAGIGFLIYFVKKQQKSGSLKRRN